MFASTYIQAWYEQTNTKRTITVYYIKFMTRGIKVVYLAYIVV